jgi:hypothetical protein
VTRQLSTNLLGSAVLSVVVFVLMVLYGGAISAAALWCEHSR